MSVLRLSTKGGGAANLVLRGIVQPLRILSAYTFLFSLCTLSSVCLIASSQAHADPSRQARIINGSAAQKAAAKGRILNSNRRGIGKSSDIDELRLESANDILYSSAKELELRKHYRMMNYFSYVQDVVDADGLDEFEQSSFAEKLAVLQTLKTVGQIIKGTPLEEYYRSAAHSVKKFKDATTLNVIRGKDGIGIEQAATDDSETLQESKANGQTVFAAQSKASRGDIRVSERKLFELKLHAGPDSIGPQLKLSENLRLNFDPLKQKATLDFAVDF